MKCIKRLRLPYCVGSALLTLGMAGCGQSEVADVDPVAQGTSVGMMAPMFAGTTGDGATWAFAPVSPGPSVLVFYRSAECGLCRLQLDRLSAHLSAFDALDATVTGLTVDTPVTQEGGTEGGYGFTIVQVDTATFREWGAIQPGASVILPATYVIDEAGIVRYRHVGRNASDRTDVVDIMTILYQMSEP